jgi:hypothetical protein
MKQTKEDIKAALEAKKKAYEEEAKKLRARMNSITAKERRAMDKKRTHVLIILGAALLNGKLKNELSAVLQTVTDEKDRAAVNAYFAHLNAKAEKAKK